MRNIICAIVIVSLSCLSSRALGQQGYPTRGQAVVYPQAAYAQPAPVVGGRAPCSTASYTTSDCTTNSHLPYVRIPLAPQFVNDFCQHVKVEIYRRNCWPRPFTAQDRQTVRAMFAIQVNNGWRLQNMLSDHHFNDNDELTPAGELKIKQILTQIPKQHRVIFISESLDPEQTTTRVANVRNTTYAMLPAGNYPPINITDVPFHSWSAERVGAIDRKYMEELPAPSLPKNSSIGGEY